MKNLTKMNAEELFDKLIKDQISREEFDQLLEGMDDEDTLARYEVYLQELFEKEVNEHFSQEEQKHSIESNLKVTKNTTSETKVKKVRKPGKNFPLAAIFVLFVGLVFSILFIISQTDSKLDTTKVAKVATTTFEPQIITKSTPRGRMFRMNLEDGSFVHLNAVSSIVYPNKFEDDTREIEVKGEAYFDVKRDEARPFHIKVKDFQVEVLGTSFSIHAYEDEDDFSITVESGQVKVILDKEGINSAILEKNQKLVYNPKTNVTEIFDVESTEELIWRKGVLRFDSTPIAKVEKILERWYGIDLVINNADIYKMTLTGIHQNENIKSVIEALTYATETKYTVKGNSIIIKY